MIAERPRTTPLEDRYAARSGRIMLTGIHALVRVMLEQRRRDGAAGLRTAGFVSGYPGSPLGGLDKELTRGDVAARLAAAEIVFRPGVNEELAATAVAGTQLLAETPAARVDGVTGWWYGKNPGFDRAADAIRHGNLTGTMPLGGAVALVGDDPRAKSSTIPSGCEALCRSLTLPLLAPSSVGGVLEVGLHAVALSRHSGLWAAMKIVADIADGSEVVELDGLESPPSLPVREAGRPPVLLPPFNLVAERDQVTARLARACEYGRLARLNRIVEEPAHPRLAVLAAGGAFAAVLRAFADLGLDSRARAGFGVRLVELRMPYPLDAATVRVLAAEVDTVLVVEDKLPFVETQVKEALYGAAHQPAVLGKQDVNGLPLLAAHGSLAADDVARALARTLGEDRLPDSARARLARIAAASPEPDPQLPPRTPTFCSGCPHSTSTRAETDRLVGAGIGCHVMIALDRGGRRGHLLGMPQMGGEGAQWLGLAPFTDIGHFTQNLGDGTFHHSGSLGIRAAVAAGAHMTFRLLYNDAVAMTGGQTPEGRMEIPALTRWLALEGVARTVVTTPDPERYHAVTLDPTAEVRHRDDLQEVARELEAVPGVTVLLHDDRCATEKRRLRKRGQLPTPAARAWINERVCEGCGDCGEQSSCASVTPVETAFGRKTRIAQSSCTQDMSCLKGDCPSFVLVTPGRGGPAGAVNGGAQAAFDASAPLPEPVRAVGDELLVRMPGVGGTGVVTVSQILQMAAHLEGRCASGLEQTGLAQKGGPVISDVRLSAGPIRGTVAAGRDSVDVLIGLDPLGASSPATLAVCSPERTRAVLNTAIAPTAATVVDPEIPIPSPARALRRVRRALCAEPVTLDAGALAEAVFADHLPANTIMLGAAYQAGLLPVSAAAIEQAIAINGVATEQNLRAFALGRHVVADPELAARLLATGAPSPASWVTAELDRHGFTGELREVIGLRLGELAAFAGTRRPAERFAAEVAGVLVAERDRVGAAAAGPVALAFARGLYGLLAVKDEYEVARLHLLDGERSRRAAEFGPGAAVAYMLHPPLLRALGLRRKLAVPSSVALPLFRLLVRARRLRGTWLDPFGRAEVRRLERALPDEYRALVARGLAALSPATHHEVAALAGLADAIRGYEAVKLRNVARFRAQARDALTALEGGGGAAAAAGGSGGMGGSSDAPPLRVVAVG